MENKSRKVKIRKAVSYDHDKHRWIYEDTGLVGVFAGYSVGFDELEFGVANFPVAIVEFPDGTVSAYEIDHIIFADAGEHHQQIGTERFW